MAAQAIPFKLTSTAIPISEDGKYTYNQVALLIPHESLRREMTRAHSVLQTFDPINHPWQALYLNIWLKEFFVPCVHEHHDLEETILTPEMRKLNIETPDHMNGAHKSLLESLNNLEKFSSEVLTLARTGAQADLMTEKVNELKTCYNGMHDHMMEHFHAEEEFWSAAITKIPEKEWARIENKIKNTVQKAKSGEMFLCSILDSMGYCFKNYSFRPEDTRWTGEDGIKIILGDVPYPVRAFIFPGFNKRYQRYKTLITAIGGDRDVLNLYRTDGTEQAGCACVIA